ncbi:MAG: hypothetical protein JNM34_07375 [Chthonomonadaceae bacterium]|nr:hypothetical protein [Chthonomonadaceae bacterium]
MDEREFLLKGWDYELWANRHWLMQLAKFRDQDRARKVMVHIIAPQRFWLDKINGIDGSFDVYDATPLEDAAFEKVSEEWKATLNRIDGTTTFDVTRPDGSQWRFRGFDAARHVLNHGTYHRGHLRGLAHAEGWDGFEDTDWTRWLRDSGQAMRLS